MTGHRRRNPELSRAIETERLLLKPIGKIRALRYELAINNDTELRAQLTHRIKRKTWLQCYRKGQMPNGRSRFTHEIVVKENGRAVGIHKIQLMHYRSAVLAVVILDRNWWGKAVPLEARKAILSYFARHAGVERFTGYVEARNFASILNYQKLGFKHSGTMHRANFDETGDRLVDYLYFELLKDDFPSYFAELEA